MWQLHVWNFTTLEDYMYSDLEDGGRGIKNGYVYSSMKKPSLPITKGGTLGSKTKTIPKFELSC